MHDDKQREEMIDQKFPDNPFDGGFPPYAEQVPTPDPEYQRGHRDGYAQRMAEEQDKAARPTLASVRFSGPAKVLRDGDILTIPTGDLTLALAPDDATDVDEGEELSLAGYPRIEPFEPEGCGVGDVIFWKEADPLVAAGAEKTSDAASFRPEIPSLNQCWNRLDAQRELLRGLHDLLLEDDEAIERIGQQLAVEKKDRVGNVDGLWRSLKRTEEELTDDFDNFKEVLVNQLGRERDTRAGDVHAINERLQTIDSQIQQIYRVLAEFPGVTRRGNNFIISTK